LLPSFRPFPLISRPDIWIFLQFSIFIASLFAPFISALPFPHELIFTGFLSEPRTEFSSNVPSKTSPPEKYTSVAFF
jgi:hypothetical protein